MKNWNWKLVAGIIALVALLTFVVFSWSEGRRAVNLTSFFNALFSMKPPPEASQDNPGSSSPPSNPSVQAKQFSPFRAGECALPGFSESSSSENNKIYETSLSCYFSWKGAGEAYGGLFMQLMYVADGQTIQDRYANWRGSLEQTVQNEAGNENFEVLVNELNQLYSLSFYPDENEPNGDGTSKVVELYQDHFVITTDLNLHEISSKDDVKRLMENTMALVENIANEHYK